MLQEFHEGGRVHSGFVGGRRCLYTNHGQKNQHMLSFNWYLFRVHQIQAKGSLFPLGLMLTLAFTNRNDLHPKQLLHHGPFIRDPRKGGNGRLRRELAFLIEFFQDEAEKVLNDLIVGHGRRGLRGFQQSQGLHCNET